MPNPTIMEAITKRLRVELTYDGFARVAEVHAYGQSSKGHDLMRVWQVRGGSAHHEPVGWKLLRLDESRGVQLTVEAAQVPRPDYRRGDKDLSVIYSQL